MRVLIAEDDVALARFVSQGLEVNITRSMSTPMVSRRARLPTKSTTTSSSSIETCRSLTA
jgi:hypothetical protein